MKNPYSKTHNIYFPNTTKKIKDILGNNSSKINHVFYYMWDQRTFKSLKSIESHVPNTYVVDVTIDSKEHNRVKSSEMDDLLDTYKQELLKFCKEEIKSYPIQIDHVLYEDGQANVNILEK